MADACRPTDGGECEHQIGALRNQLVLSLQQASRNDLSDGRLTFVPRGELISILEYHHVRNMLKVLLGSAAGLSEGDVINRMENIARYVCPEIHCHCGDELCTGARGIFASLVMVGREKDILEFYKHEGPRCDQQLKPTEEGSLPSCTLAWEPWERSQFIRSQWQFRTPYFKKFAVSGVQRLNDELTLPWTEITAPPSIPGEQTSTYAPQTSGVRKIKIHRDHHAMGDGNQYFALKKLQKSQHSNYSEYRFEVEVSTYSSLGDRHERITQLLAAIQHKDSFYLIIPWAEKGSLKHFWESVDSTTLYPDAAQRTDWLLGECLGLADGLAYMHGLTETKPDQTYLHADIKPENILVFVTHGTTGDSVYRLKFADFGLSRPVGAAGIQPWKITAPITHRPPEMDMRKSPILLAWDVWGLGCLYSQFITWSIQGREGVATFENARKREQSDSKSKGRRGETREDTFFRLRRTNPWLCRLPSVQVAVLPVIKRSVSEHFELLKSSKCSERLQNFLTYIETRMLEIDDMKRANPREVASRLQNFKDEEIIVNNIVKRV
ncbi:kinase-like domain-containing protein [Xylariales sp. PMI_506]|nr:kinase-like domain-containing protein [Xylariales sp. PMI_506]